MIFALCLLFCLYGSYLVHAQNVSQCIDDSNGTTPYVIPEGQSILYYDPDVTIAADEPFSTCAWVPEGYTDTPARDCPADAQYVLTPSILMASSLQLRKTMTQAQRFIINSSANKSIEYFQDITEMHCSIQYYSCYNYTEYLIIQNVIKNFIWNSFTLTFNNVTCDVSNSGIYILAGADSSSQKKLFRFVDKLEKQINNEGVQIKQPRIEKFHMTIAAANYTYPSDCIVDKLNKQLVPKFKNKQFGSVLVCCFRMLIGDTYTNYYAQDFSQCIDDPNGTAPYIVPEGQSILYYDPDVTIAADEPFSTCAWVPEGYTDTPARDCPADAQYVLTPSIPMGSSLQLRKTMTRAQRFIINSSANKSIIYFQDISTIHCSIQYYSCYNYTEYLIIQKVIKSFIWNSFTLTFDRVTCDVSTNGTYILAKADMSSQRKLFRFVDKLEKQINNEGVQIKQPRIDKFHLTIAAVNYTYPSDCIVDKLNKQLVPTFKNQQFGSVLVCCIHMKIGDTYTNYYAQDCNKNHPCIVDIQPSEIEYN
ncbi:unnamed protein product [Adineta steineri]|uniref:Protein kinase A anchor protein nuclear localisation signal domain-containing protein n=1 Tax=Adineta steineri TaxID=433720 RepID=A0A818XTL8_9BILA|nr:unnamed protein product [Adineta steineri]CAF3744905.1 unnamed protein product [Adineta steineri]